MNKSKFKNNNKYNNNKKMIKIFKLQINRI